MRLSRRQVEEPVVRLVLLRLVLLRLVLVRLVLVRKRRPALVSGLALPLARLLELLPLRWVRQ
jgi:hypothetical protein